MPDWWTSSEGPRRMWARRARSSARFGSRLGRAPMVVTQFVIVLALAVLAVPLAAAAPADRDIAAAITDIERFEAEFAELEEARATNVKRAQRLLEISRERLDASANQDHPSWVEADRRLTALLDHMEALLEGGGAATATPPTATPPTGTSPAASEGEQPAAATAQTQAATQTQANAPAEMISQDRARIAKLNRDIDSAIATLDQGGAEPFQDPNYVAGREAVVERLRQAFERFSAFPDDPEVVAAAAGLARLESMLAFGREHAAAALAELGDVQATLRAANDRLAAMAVPETPSAPYADGEVQAWLVALAQTRQAAVAGATALEPFEARAYLPQTRGTPEQGAAYDMQDLERLRAGFIGHIRTIDDAFQTFTANLDLQVADVADSLAYFAALDPHDPQDQATALLGEGKASEMQARLAELEGLVATAIQFDQSLGREADRTGLLAQVQAAAADYAAKRATALEVVRMPEAASDDPALIEIARAALTNPDYEVGPIARLVVNADRRSHEMETSDVEIDQIEVGLGGSLTASGTQTTYRYAWEQFQVATAEPVGDRHYIFYNTLKYFTAGASTTPLERWILAGRMQSVEIPEANIPLD